MGQDNHGQDSQGMTAGQDSLGRTTGTGQSGHFGLKVQPDHVSLDKTEWGGWPEHVSKDKAGTGQLWQDSQHRTPGEDSQHSQIIILMLPISHIRTPGFKRQTVLSPTQMTKFIL